MHHDRITAKLNPNKRESRQDRSWRDEDADDALLVREPGYGKAQRTYGARQQEAMHQIREIQSRGH